MNPAATSIPYEGLSGAINVSIVAFSIVFGVLFGLTVMIYAIRIFSGGDDHKPEGKGPSAGAPAKAAATPAAAPAPVAAGNPQAKVVAAITAAILAATGGQGRVLSIAPAGPAAVASQLGECRWTRAWRSSGVAALTGNQVDRAWKR